MMKCFARLVFSAKAYRVIHTTNEFETGRVCVSGLIDLVSSERKTSFNPSISTKRNSFCSHNPHPNYSAHLDLIENKMSSNVDRIKEIRLPYHGQLSDYEYKANVDRRSRSLDETGATAKEDTLTVEEVVKRSSQCLLQGGVMAVPTDTIYGIAGLAQNNEAVSRIYDIKQRNYEKPLAISVGTIDDIYRWSNVTVPRQLLQDLLPGPVTVVFERSPELNPALNPNTSLVGIRIPDHVFMKVVAKQCGSPIALTSANVSGDKSCLQVEEFQHLWPLLDLVVNGGKLNDSEESRLGSTVVDLSVQGTYRIIRPGSAHAATCAILQDRYKLKESSQGVSSR